jgi:2-methylfumaryl-CoA hydratase
VAPFFAGGTVYAWSEIVDMADVPAQSDLGALRILTRATRDLPCADYPIKEATAEEPGVILEFDYWALLPR